MSTNIVRGGIVAAICGAAIFVGAATPAPAFTLSSSSSSSLKQSGASSHIEHVYYYRRAYGYRGAMGIAAMDSTADMGTATEPVAGSIPTAFVFAVGSYYLEPLALRQRFLSRLIRTNGNPTISAKRGGNCRRSVRVYWWGRRTTPILLQKTKPLADATPESPGRLRSAYRRHPVTRVWPWISCAVPARRLRISNRG